MGSICARRGHAFSGTRNSSSAIRRRALIRAAALAEAACVALAPAAAAQEILTYTYDGRGRLVKVEHSGTANSGVSSCYAYDAADNRTASNVETSSACSASSGTTPPSFSVGDDSSTEGTNVVFTVTRSGSSTGSYSLDYATANGTAVASSDYTAKSGTISFADGVMSANVAVATTDDTTVESSETFYLDVSNASGGATIADSRGAGTITDNDSASTCDGVSFAVSNASVTEGGNLSFTVTKTGTTTDSCSVNYATANNTAVSGSDYTAKSGTVTFSSSQTSATVSVATTEDTTVENTETMYLNLSAASGSATITDSQGVGTINDDDSSSGNCGGVSYTVNNTSATEASPLVFTVTKAGSTSSSCSVSYATANGTAVAGGTNDDYAATSGTLTFTSSQTSKTVSVTTYSNGFMSENTETMYLNLSGATDGASISDSQGIGTIYDDGGGGCTNCLQSEPLDPSLDNSTTTDPATTQDPTTTEPAPPPGAA